MDWPTAKAFAFAMLQLGKAMAWELALRPFGRWGRRRGRLGMYVALKKYARPLRAFQKALAQDGDVLVRDVQEEGREMSSFVRNIRNQVLAAKRERLAA